MKEIIFQVEEDNVDGGFVARALGYGITTQAETIDELKKMIFDALRCHFDNVDEIPKVIRLHFVKEEVLVFSLMKLPRDIDADQLIRALGRFGYERMPDRITHPRSYVARRRTSRNNSMSFANQGRNSELDIEKHCRTSRNFTR
jgi:hypothetical protein